MKCSEHVSCRGHVYLLVEWHRQAKPPSTTGPSEKHTCCEEYGKRLSPIMKAKAEIAKKTIGALVSQKSMYFGGLKFEYLSRSSAIAFFVQGMFRAYTVDFLHIMLSKLLMPEETLKTRERNQKRFTALLKRPVVCWYENWSVVAVILEKNVAMVVKAK